MTSIRPAKKRWIVCTLDKGRKALCCPNSWEYRQPASPNLQRRAIFCFVTSHWKYWDWMTLTYTTPSYYMPWPWPCTAQHRLYNKSRLNRAEQKTHAYKQACSAHDINPNNIKGRVALWWRKNRLTRRRRRRGLPHIKRVKNVTKSADKQTVNKFGENGGNGENKSLHFVDVICGIPRSRSSCRMLKFVSGVAAADCIVR